jgi:carboxypeptidase D
MLQNTTFGGIQGFTRQPSTSWWDDNGNWAGIIHQERNWTYALVYGAGHEVPADQPVAVSSMYNIHCHSAYITSLIQSYTLFREYVLGSNQTGSLPVNGDTSNVIGGENPTLKQDAIPGQAAITYGSGTTEGSTVWPSATVAAFESYVGQIQVTGTDNIAASPTAGGT